MFTVDQLEGELLSLLTRNFDDSVIAECVTSKVLDALERGELELVDVDNYIRNVVTADMQAVLLSLQDSRACSG